MKGLIVKRMKLYKEFKAVPRDRRKRLLNRLLERCLTQCFLPNPQAPGMPQKKNFWQVPAKNDVSF